MCRRFHIYCTCTNLSHSSSGIAEIPSEVPDTITTWNAEAFAINRRTGLGISTLTELTVKKDLFVSLELPYSVIFGEMVTITPIVFYFGKKERTVVRIYATDQRERLILNFNYTVKGALFTRCSHFLDCTPTFCCCRFMCK